MADHGSTWNIICKNKKTLNKEKTKTQLDSWLQTNYYTYSNEWVYKNITPKIVCEKFMQDSESQQLRDYKFFCFNGKPLYLKVVSNRYEEYAAHFFDMSWDKVELNSSSTVYRTPSPSKPAQFDEMVEVVEKLAKGFKYVRVDLYLVDQKIYFGEMTFYPDAGYGEYPSFLHRYLFGKQLNLHDPQNPY